MTRMLANGLTVHDRGAAGILIEEDNERETAEVRFQRVLHHMPSMQLPARAELLLRLPADVAILNMESIGRIGQDGTTYVCDGMGYCVEWSLDGGWLDRRVLPERLAALICDARGCRFSQSDVAAASRALAAAIPEYAETPDAIGAFVSDAWAWWFTRLNGPMFAHATRLRPFQLLTRAALARCTHGRPQRPGATKHDRKLETTRLLIDATRTNSRSLRVFDEIVHEAGRIARARGDRAQGRRCLLDFIETRIADAAREGRAQLVALACTSAAIKGGGISGAPWAPRTIYDYLQFTLRELVADMCCGDIDGWDGWDWQASYARLFDLTEVSQHRKLSGFLQAFHRGMVVLGFPPLPAGLSRESRPLPPAAAFIDDRSLLRALRFASARASDPRVRLQATVVLLVARHIPMRTHEIFRLRLGDVELTAPMTVSVNPARGDGGAKTQATKRPPEEVRDLVLQKALAALWRMRRTADLALDDQDMLFGRPGQPGQTYEQERTMRLVNASLRWATGDRLASIYDLRHTVFTERVERILMGA